MKVCYFHQERIISPSRFFRFLSRYLGTRERGGGGDLSTEQGFIPEYDDFSL